MKKRWYVGSLIAVVLVVFIYYGLQAQQPNPPGQQEKQMRGQQLMKMRERIQLNLTDEQKEQMRKIMSQARKENIQRRADLQVARIELGELLSDKNTSDAAIKDKQEELLRLQNDQSRSRLNTRLQMKQVMTEEQWKKAVQMRKWIGMRRMHNRFGAGIGQRPGMGGQPGMMMQREGRRTMPGGRGPHWFNNVLPDREDTDGAFYNNDWLSEINAAIANEWQIVLEEDQMADDVAVYE